jgi:hypothetical protein
LLPSPRPVEETPDEDVGVWVVADEPPGEDVRAAAPGAYAATEEQAAEEAGEDHLYAPGEGAEGSFARQGQEPFAQPGEEHPFPPLQPSLTAQLLAEADALLRLRELLDAPDEALPGVERAGDAEQGLEPLEEHGEEERLLQEEGEEQALLRGSLLMAQ